MDRIIDFYLNEWYGSPRRKPLIVRGARQVGKTNAIRRFSTSFKSFVEINFELIPDARLIFQKSLEPQIIIKQLMALTGNSIIPGETLLFLDEVQIEPSVITSLRYFYEMLPELHVIAAGSLLNFAIEQIGMPVGRVSYYYMYPLSFIEFLCALKQYPLAREIITHPLDQPMQEPLHSRALNLLGEYVAVGGMPEAVKTWRDTSNIQETILVHNEIIDTYKDDFPKYARKAQIKYVDLIFNNIHKQLGSEYKTSRIEGNFRKRELIPALNLLEKARVIHKVEQTSAQGIPLAAQVNPSSYKFIMLDIALSQTLLGLSLKDWIINPHDLYINKGPLIEAFIGQEILAYSDPLRPANLYYWQKSVRNDSAEVDYITELNQLVIPAEVKAKKGSTLKSIRVFLDSHPQSPYGIRFSIHDFSFYDRIHSIPLYAVSNIIPANKTALISLVEKGEHVS